MHYFQINCQPCRVKICVAVCVMVCLAGGLAGCGGDSGSDNNDNNVDRPDFAPQRPTVSVTDAPDTDVYEFTMGVTQFGFDLYRQLGSKPGNLVLSPFGIHSSLAVLTSGMNDEAKRKARKALRTEMANDRFEGAASTVMHQLLNNRFGSDSFYVGNALWLRKDLKFQSNFMNKATTSFGAQSYVCDFAGDSSQAVEDINAWMAQQSNGLVKQLVSENSVTADTVLVSTNVVLFQAELDDAFEKKKTKDVDFAISESHSAKVPMMQRISRMSYGETDDWQMVSMSYLAHTYRINILLPKKRHGLASAAAKLDVQELDSLNQSMRSQHAQLVSLWLPRFSFESRLTVTQALKAMGLRGVFLPATDVFTQLVEQNDVPMGLDSVITAARIEATEKGVKAGSGSAAMVAKDGPPREKQTREPIKVHCDHPFIFMIYHNRTNALLFMGRVADPS